MLVEVPSTMLVGSTYW